VKRSCHRWCSAHPAKPVWDNYLCPPAKETSLSQGRAYSLIAVDAILLDWIIPIENASLSFLQRKHMDFILPTLVRSSIRSIHTSIDKSSHSSFYHISLNQIHSKSTKPNHLPLHKRPDMNISDHLQRISCWKNRPNW
jgi:hypothetical protein